MILAENIFDLSGPDFLALYVKLLVLAVAVAVTLWVAGRGPYDAPESKIFSLTPLEVAYLAGGAKVCVESAIAGLLHEGALAPGTIMRTFAATKDVNARGKRSSVERTVLASAGRGSGAKIDQIRSDALAPAEDQASRLVSQGLVLPEGRRFGVTLLLLSPFVLAIVIGSMKLMVGISRGRPVGFLFLLILLAVGLGVAAWALRPLRTFRGDKALSLLKDENAALAETARSAAGRDDLTGSDVALAFGLFGMGALGGPVLNHLVVALTPPGTGPGSGGGASCGSSCGSSCGGGCGGGCGGCGG